MVPKKDGGKQPCGDYRCLNNIPTHERYRLPNEKFLFSKIDLVMVYHQIPVAYADIPKTAIITAFGPFEYLRMPFGLENADQSFQRFTATIFCGLSFVFKYLNNILIFNRS